ncbi:ADS3 [Symbiodinium sp. CCMP2592]|nr:ADS3 [Symbiodinium sp. CCMP2592]
MEPEQESSPDGMSVEGLATEWDAVPELRELMRTGRALFSEASEKQVDKNTPIKNEAVLLPLLSRMQMAGKVLPNIEDLRTEVRAFYVLCKREFHEVDDVHRAAWLIRKNLVYMKMKCRRREFSTDSTFQKLCLTLSPELQEEVDAFNERQRSRSSRSALDPDVMDSDEDAWEEGGPDDNDSADGDEADMDPAALLDRFRSLTGQAEDARAASADPPSGEGSLGADDVPRPTEREMEELEAEAAPPRVEQPSEDPIFGPFPVICIDDEEDKAPEPEVTPPVKVTWTSTAQDGKALELKRLRLEAIKKKLKQWLGFAKKMTRHAEYVNTQAASDDDETLPHDIMQVPTAPEPAEAEVSDMEVGADALRRSYQYGARLGDSSAVTLVLGEHMDDSAETLVDDEPSPDNEATQEALVEGEPHSDQEEPPDEPQSDLQTLVEGEPQSDHAAVAETLVEGEPQPFTPDQDDEEYITRKDQFVSKRAKHEAETRGAGRRKAKRSSRSARRLSVLRKRNKKRRATRDADGHDSWHPEEEEQEPPETPPKAEESAPTKSGKAKAKRSANKKLQRVEDVFPVLHSEHELYDSDAIFQITGSVCRFTSKGPDTEQLRKELRKELDVKLSCVYLNIYWTKLRTGLHIKASNRDYFLQSFYMEHKAGGVDWSLAMALSIKVAQIIASNVNELIEGSIAELSDDADATARDKAVEAVMARADVLRMKDMIRYNGGLVMKRLLGHSE